MASSKKAPKRKTFRRGGKTGAITHAPKAVADIPTGYIMPADSQAPSQDWDGEPVLEGVCVAIKTVQTQDPNNKKKTRDSRIMTVKRNDGVLRAVWESKSLEGLFNDVKPGSAVYIRFEGKLKLKGGKTLRKFVTGYKPAEGKSSKGAPKKPF